MAKKIKKKKLLENNNPLDAKKKIVSEMLEERKKEHTPVRMRIDALISFDIYQKLNELVFLKSTEEKRPVSKREIIEKAIECYYQKYKYEQEQQEQEGD
jgi:DNA-directed RNA polymerase subunit M/transcription elongation factor TFIIS